MSDANDNKIMCSRCKISKDKCNFSMKNNITLKSCETCLAKDKRYRINNAEKIKVKKKLVYEKKKLDKV